MKARVVPDLGCQFSPLGEDVVGLAVTERGRVHLTSCLYIEAFSGHC